MKICKICQKEYEPKVNHQIYCSQKCSNKAEYQRRKAKRLLIKPIIKPIFQKYPIKVFDEFYEVKCRHCHKVFTIKLKKEIYGTDRNPKI